MKNLTSVLSTMLMVSCSALAHHAMAEDRSLKVTEELCVVPGSEKLRSKMYKKSAETEEILELERQSCWMVANKDLKKLGDQILDENALLFLDGGEILYGREQQIAMFADILKIQGFYLSYEPVEAHVSASKDMAWAFGVYKTRMPGQEMEVGKYVSVWEKKNGKWLNVVEIRNPFK